MSKRVTNTIRRIYKQNMQLARSDEYPSAPEHQSSNSEITPDSPVKSVLYAEIDKNSQARSIVGLPINSNSTMTSMNLKSSSSSRRNRHRRLGSGDFNAAMKEAKQVKMVHMETQTETAEAVPPKPTAANPKKASVNRLSASLCDLQLVAKRLNSRNPAAHHLQNNNQSMNAIAPEDKAKSMSSDTVDCQRSCTDSDYLNSNEQLEMRESSDEDNLEKLGQRVSQFFNEICESNGNDPTTDRRLLFNLITNKRGCIAINNKDQVTIISRSNASKNAPNVYQVFKADPNEPTAGAKDLNCNNDDSGDEDEYDECWTDDDEAEDSDNNHTSLRRKRCVFLIHRQNLISLSLLFSACLAALHECRLRAKVK